MHHAAALLCATTVALTCGALAQTPPASSNPSWAQNETSSPDVQGAGFWTGACDTIWDPVECNLTSNCYYGHTGVCTEKAVIAPRLPANATTATPWCYDHFPFEVTLLLYCLNCFSTGFGLIGLWYNVYHFNRPTKVDPKTRIRYKNRLMGYQLVMFLWCLLFVGCGGVLTVSALLFFIRPDNCLWVYTSYAYVAVLFLSTCFTLYWLYAAVVREKHARRKQDIFDSQRVEQMFNSVELVSRGVALRYL
eukprot:TRINITY_DN58317_c0_g1_i1.p1 TRINITY_DN58317_c0_g1~~TRINITY_DN58317_c0_g1_i1.p1  ORF type:complete len:249 (+),score=63.03 TRINITY_DN58317_c0_g1_i1:77-823(+)